MAQGSRHSVDCVGLKITMAELLPAEEIDILKWNLCSSCQQFNDVTNHFERMSPLSWWWWDRIHSAYRLACVKKFENRLSLDLLL